MSLNCQKCGLPMPELDEELVSLARRAGGVTLTHDVCPGAEQPQPEGRYFEVRVEVVEVVETERGVVDGSTMPTVDVVELLSFRYGVRAKNLDEAMRPLALGLGEKWSEGEKHAKIVDADAGGVSS